MAEPVEPVLVPLSQGPRPRALTLQDRSRLVVEVVAVRLGPVLLVLLVLRVARQVQRQVMAMQPQPTSVAGAVVPMAQRHRAQSIQAVSVGQVSSS